MKCTQNDYIRKILQLKLEKFVLYNLFMDYHPMVTGKVAIYGAGILGKQLISCFEDKSKIICYVDAKDGLGRFCNIPIIGYDKSDYAVWDNINTVIVTPVWDFEEIKNKIIIRNNRLNVISLEKLVEEL